MRSLLYIPVFILCFLPAILSSQVLPWMSMHAGVLGTTETNTQTPFINGSEFGGGYSMHGYVGLNLLKVVDLNFGGGYARKRFWEEDPPCDNNGNCPDRVLHKYRFPGIFFQGRFQITFIHADFGSGFIHPYVGVSGHISANPKVDISALDQQGLVMQYNAYRPRTVAGIEYYEMGARWVTEEGIYTHVGFSGQFADNLFNDRLNGIYGIGIEAGVGVRILKLTNR